MVHLAKISIIIPVYNAEVYVSECLQSALNQTLKEIEIICIDDGSTDKSLEILKTFAEKDDPIILIHQPNGGLGKARNTGLSKASGEYIMFLDSDDFLELNACELAYEQITKNNDDVVLFESYEFIDGNKTQKTSHNRLKYFNDGYKTGASFHFYDLKKRFVSGCEVWYKIYKKSFLDKNNIRFHDIHFLEDVPFYFQVITQANTVSILNQKLYNYRLRSNTNLLSVGPLSYWKDSFLVRQKSYEYVLKSNYPLLLRSFLPYHIDSIIYWYKKWEKIPKFPKKIYYELIHQEFHKLRCAHKDLLKEISTEICDYKTFKKVSKENYYVHLLRKCLEIVYKKERKDTKRTITLLGFKFSYIHNRKKIMYKKLSKNYNKHIKKIRNKIKKGQKIRVAFYVNDSKWKSQKVFDLMTKDEHYDPFILVRKNDVDSTHTEFQTQEEIESIIDFYKSKGMPVYRAYDYQTNTFIPLSNFLPDIVFYSRPWCVAKKHFPEEVSSFALTCYIPYFISNSPNYIECDRWFQNELWRYYIINNEIYKEYSKTMPNEGKNLKVVGYPLLEDYLNYNPDKANKTFVIYAPHWSVGNSMIKYATFEWNGKYILDFAKKHPEIKWVFKPHPILKKQLITENIMSKKEVNQYWQDWDKIAITYEGSDYLDLFKQSRAMITDCGSFLAEYMPTQNPVILLRSKNATPYNVFAQKVTEYYYSVWDLKELEQKLDEVIIQGDDPGKKKRLIRLKELNLVVGSSKNILDDLNKEFAIK